MPRLPPNVLQCSVYLYNTPEDAARGARFGGSGFMLAVPCVESDRVTPVSVRDQVRLALGRPVQDNPEKRLYESAHCYLVTNRHVRARFARINTTDGGYRILDLRDNLWIDHPGGDEVSICAIETPDDRTDSYAVIPSDMVLTDEAVLDLGVGPGDEVFMIGRFVNHEGAQRNLPSVRFGHVSMMPLEPIRTRRQDGVVELEGYLVEAYSFAGYSGSPVFLHLAPWELEFLTDDDIARRFAGQEVSTLWLLGINWGHLPISTAATMPGGQEVRVTLNAGMMCVAPARKILETLNDPAFIERRRFERQGWEDDGAAILDS